jgi:hypothetical protein
MFAPPQGADALPKTLPPPAPLPSLRSGAPARSANDSHVRLRAPVVPLPRIPAIEYVDAQDLLDEISEDQLTLSVNLAGLEESLAQAPRDASARAAMRTLDARHADLCALRDALGAVQAAAIDPRLQRLVVSDSPLADYLRGLYSRSPR